MHFNRLTSPVSRATVALTVLFAIFCVIVPAAALAKGGDRDRDGMSDRWEKRHKVKSADGDADRDGLSNGVEFDISTHPRKKDSDGDGRADGREDADRDRLANRDELRFGYDPDEADSDDDGVKDGAEGAGVVKSVDGATVTIALAGGSTLTGTVTDETVVECGELDDYREDEDADDDADEGEESESDEGEDADDADADDDSEGDEPGDETDCATLLAPGALVHSADLVDGIFESIELVVD